MMETCIPVSAPIPQQTSLHRTVSSQRGRTGRVLAGTALYPDPTYRVAGDAVPASAAPAGVAASSNEVPVPSGR